MRTAIFADVHGNLPALETFLSATQGRVDAYFNLGDTVGYGPWPDACVTRVRQLCGEMMIEGNHERLHLGTDDLSLQLPLVQKFYAVLASRCQNLYAITGLPRHLDFAGYRCQHAAPLAPDEGAYLVGHSHRQGQDPHHPRVFHVGSIGQCRTAINRAEWLELDTETGQFEAYSIPYPFAAFLDTLRSFQYPAECVAYYTGKPRGNPHASHAADSRPPE